MADENIISDEAVNCPKLSDTEEEPNAIPSVEDKELDDLLDSALEDFDKPTAVTETVATVTQDATPPIPNQPATEPVLPSGELSSQQEALFNELFQAAGSEEGGKDFEAMMQQMMSGQPEDLLQQFNNMSQTVDDMFPSPDGVGGGQFEDTLQQTLGSLAQNAQELQNAGSEADIMRMLSGMGLDDSGGGEGGDMDFLPMMQGMMKSLMSKEVLYPSLKEITQKYPKWLEDNTTTVSASELEKYKKQYQLMSEIVTDFEQEKTDDTDDIKKQRFEKIMDTMQRMQALGQPPKDLVGDMPAGLDLDANGFPKFPASPEQCSVM